MPIRFRCAYCNQLMGITRRKAGAVVQCPRCAGQVIVPDAEPVKEKHPVKGEGKPAPNEVFERSDIDKLLQEPLVFAPPKTLPDSSGSYHNAPPASAVMPPLSPSAGLLLTPSRMTVLAVVVVLLMGMAFFLGLLVGGGQ